MGCTDQQSNFQYTFYDPKSNNWWCSWGHAPVYVAPKGYELQLAQYIKNRGKMKVTFNRTTKNWEARPTR